MCIFFSLSRIPSFPPFVKEISGNARNLLPQICYLTHKALSIRERKIRTCLHRKRFGFHRFGAGDRTRSRHSVGVVQQLPAG